MRFHLIDRIDSFEKGRSIRARKLTSRNEDYWDLSGSDPIMPQSLLLETLCQAGSWLIILSTERRKRAALLSLGTITFLGNVGPGEVLELEGHIVSITDEVAVLSGRVLSAGEAVLEAQDIMCALMEADKLEDTAATARMQQMLTREEVLL